MNKKDNNKNFIHFLEKWLIIGIVLFLIIQITGGIIIDKTITQQKNNEFWDDYIGHWYNGTFFINMTVDENFESMEKYKEMNEKMNNNLVRNISYYAGSISSIVALILISIAAYKERKKKLLEGKTPIIIILSGIFIFIYKLFEEIDLFIQTIYYRKYSIGFLKTTSYYPMIYNIVIISGLLISMGLILREKQLKKQDKDTKNNEKIINIFRYIIIIVGISFIIYRLDIRTKELIMIIMNKNINLRLPFYYYIFDLPRNFATTKLAYLKLSILRYIKDLPVFISSIISILLFTKIIKTTSKEENKKRYKIIFITLIISSLIFNILGLAEVNLLNKEFLYQYKEATYTIAIRSLCEPILYGFYIFLFKYYTEVVDKYN